MGRRSDNPADQAAKGFPGHRKSKVEKQIAEAERLAGLLAAAPARADEPLAPPAFINDPRLKGALAVWEELAPRLSKINLLEPDFRHTFAMFCVYASDFVAATDEILRKGYSISVKTVSGSMMPRINPAVQRRDLAADFILKLSSRFGLTPLDRYGLMKDQSAASQFGGLFGGHGNQPTPPAPQGEEPAQEENPLGALRRHDSPPPQSQH